MSLKLERRPWAYTDTECLPNYWSIGFLTDEGKIRVFEKWNDSELDRKAIAGIMRRYTIVTFNGLKYDGPMIAYAMQGASNAELFELSMNLIETSNANLPIWRIVRDMELELPGFVDHIDLMNVSPGAPRKISLKLYAGFLHSKKMQEMPINYEEPLDEVNHQVLCSYHGNDLYVTRDLAHELKPQIELRHLMSERYGIDVRSKSDAQVAEAVMKVVLEKRLGRRIYSPDIEPGYFSYKFPSWVSFKTPAMRAAMGVIGGARFKVDGAGKVHGPKEVHALNVLIGESTYQMGLGGLHSQEKRISHFSDEDEGIFDRDVTSYYPMSILLQGMSPKHLGPAMLELFREIYVERVAAKKAGDKNKAEFLKIVLNGVFGKLGSAFSIFFSPSMMIQVTLTGQLAILMLIERLALAGFKVLSANTDGIVTRVPRHRKAEFDAIFAQWEKSTGYVTEEKEYVSTHSASVNAYIAIERDEKTGKLKAKRKGEYTKSGPGQEAASGMKKNPMMEICTEAVIEYLLHGTPIEDTIEWCPDIRKFILARRVTGGAIKDDQFIGKAIRWYFAKGVSGSFKTRGTGNTVPMTEGGKLMLELSEAVPADLDHEVYIREAYAILEDIGMPATDPALRGRKGRFLGRSPDTKSIHWVDAKTGAAICGKERGSLRNAWIEFKTLPEGMKICGKCKKADAI